MRLSTCLSPVLLLALASCLASSEKAPPSAPTRGPVAPNAETTSFQAAGPQSYTPEARPKGRETSVRQMWKASIGRTDHRTTMAFVDGAVWVGAKRGKNTEPGVYVIDGRSGARRALLPGAKGDVVGIALEGDRVFSSGSSGEVAVTTKAGVVVFRTNVGAAVVTPPTLFDADGDGVVDIVVGDAKGRVTLLDGKTGKARWTRAISETSKASGAVRALSSATEARPSIGSGLAVGDLDGDGGKEIVGGTESGQLFALRAKDGDVAWQVSRASALRAAPLLADIDADKKLEVIAGWADGDVAIVDGKTGKEVWTARVEEDDGDPSGLLASPTPMPGGSLIVPTARWGKEDSVVLLRAHARAYRSKHGSVVASPVLGTIQLGTNLVEAVVGTTLGDVVAFDAAGGMSSLFHFDEGIEAPAMIADVENNGLQQLVVATRDGQLAALAIHAAVPPVLPRARGASLRNDGVLPAIDLGWRLP